MSDQYKNNIFQLNTVENNFYEQIKDTKTEFEILSLCSRIASVFGLPYFSIFRIPNNLEQKISDLDLISNWPELLISEYDAHNLLAHSPVISYLQESTEPLVFNTTEINKGRPDGNASFVANLFERFGIKNGVYFSVHLAKGQLGAVSFSGSSMALTHTKMIELNYLANLIYSKIHRLRSSDEKPDYDLKEIEIKCLNWTSQGKTSSEIGEILNLSEYTVNLYLKNATDKLGGANSAHTISKAIRLNIIN